MIKKVKFALLPLAAGLLLAGCQGFSEWARKVENLPAGTGIQGRAAVDVVLNVLKKYQASPEHAKQAEVAGIKALEALPEKEKVALLKKAESDEPVYIAVTVPPAPETHAEAESSVMLFDVKSQKILGNNRYDLKNAPNPEEETAANKEFVIDGFQVTIARPTSNGIRLN